MKRFKKILSLSLAIMMLSTMLGVMPASAATASVSEWRAGFNNTTLPLNGGWNNGIWSYYSCGIFNTFERGLYYATNKFGKSDADAALHMSKDASFYTLRGTIMDMGATSMRFRFQMATDTNGGGGFSINGSWQMKNAPSLGGDFLFGFVNGAVYVLGQRTDMVWTHETWHDIDIVVNFGNNSDISIVVDGEPAYMGEGKTFDGVKSTAWKLPIITGRQAANEGGMDQFFKFNTYGGDNGFYIDNWILQGTTETVLEADGELFKSPSCVISGSVINSALPVANLADGTKTLKDRPGDADGDNAYLELSGPVNAYFYRNYEQTGGQSTFRSDIMYSRAFEMNTYDGKEDVQLELCYPGSALLLWNTFGNANAGGGYFGEAGKSADAQPAMPSDNEWHDFEWVVDNTGEGRGYSTLEVYFDGMPQIRYAGAYPSGVPHQLRVGFGSAWGVDNMRETLMKYKPHVKAVTYTTAEGDATDDYNVNAEVEKITVELTETIATANADTVKLYNADGAEVDANVTLLEDNKTIELTLNDSLATSSNYQIRLLPELVCEDSHTDGGAWYQTLDTTKVYDFKTAASPFDWKKVQLITSYRSGEGTAESPYEWSDPAAYAGGYIGDSSKVGVNVTMVNTSGSDKSAYVIAAAYRKDKLIGFGMVPYTFTEGESTATVLTNEIRNSVDLTVKAFVWDGTTFGMPHTKSFHLYTWDNSTGSFAGGTPSVSQ